MFGVSRSKVAVSLLVVETVLLAPLLYSPWLRFDYTQTIARWLAKITPPNAVHLGDSITAGGRNFNDARDINLASNGLRTTQIAGLLPQAESLRPRFIVIMAGVNDAAEGHVDTAEITRLWRTICQTKGVIVTLATPTSFDTVNARLKQINRIVASECAARPMIDLGPALADRRGRVRSQYTIDGVHLSPDAHRLWRAELARFGA